ncbi:MAG: Polysaccharide biosynthesis protein [Pedobacter sp.]|nr:Polysaccharide biosynthesis protein [Pedobacter sp.]
MSVFKKFLGDTAVYGLSTIISRLFNFILTPIFTRVFAPSVYGIFTKMYSYVSILNAVLAFGMETTYFRYMNKHEDRKQEVYNNAFLTILVIATLFLISGLLWASAIAKMMLNGDYTHLQDQTRYVRFFVWLSFVDALAVIPFAKLRADGKPFKYSLIKIVNIATFIGLNLIFLFVIPYIIKHQLPSANWLASWYRFQWIGYVFIANLVASVTALLLLLPQILQVQFKFDTALFLKMLSYSWPILVANLSFIINENLDKILLSRYLPDAIADRDTGIYGAVCKLAIFLSIFIQAFRLGAEPFFFSHAKATNAKQTYAIILQYFVVALSVIFVALIANIEILKHFIPGKNHETQMQYWSGLPAVPFLLFGYMCLGIYMNLSIWYRLSDQTRFGLYISVVGAILTIILNVVLIPRYSYMGSAWVSMIAYFVMMVISYVLGQKYYPIPYNLNRILAYIVASTILVSLSFWVFKSNIFIGNALLVLFVAAIAYFEKDELKLILSRK